LLFIKNKITIKTYHPLYQINTHLSNFCLFCLLIPKTFIMKKITFSLVALLATFAINAQSDCNNALALTVDAGGSTTTSVSSITGTPPETSYACVTAGDTTPQAGNWYSYTATEDIIVTITSPTPQAEGDYFQVLHIFNGGCDNLACEAFDFFSNTDPVIETSFLAEANETYFIVFDDLYDQLGSGANTAFEFTIATESVDCTTSLPYTEDAENNNKFLACHEVIDNDGNGSAWIREDLDLDGDGNTEDFFTNGSLSTGQKDDYLFSPALSLTAGQEYTLTFNFQAADSQNNAANENLQVIIAAGNTVVDANNGVVLYTEEGIIQNGVFADLETNATTIQANFTPQSSGDHYLAFRSFAPAPTGFLLLFDYTVETALAVDKFETSNFDYYVANERLNLSSDRNMGNIVIYNISGKQMNNLQIKDTSSAIDIQSFSTGVYLAKVEIEGQTKTFKFLKN